MSSRPILPAVVVVLTRDDKVLVIKRGPKTVMPGYWAPLSGRLEEGEQPEDAAVREVMEEVGLTARSLRRVWECPSSDAKFQLEWWLGEAESGDFVLDPGEVAEARWVTVDEFLSLDPTFEADREFFADVYPALKDERTRPGR